MNAAHMTRQSHNNFEYFLNTNLRDSDTLKTALSAKFALLCVTLYTTDSSKGVLVLNVLHT